MEKRTVYVRRVQSPRQGMSLAAGLVVIVLILVLGWVAFLVSTRGFEQLKQDVRTSFQGAAYAAKETSHDAALTAKVKTALALSKDITARQIEVESKGEVVTLRGDVPSEEVRTRAAAVAQNVPGVTEVLNHLYVAK